MLNRVIIGLGSNCDKEKNIEWASRLLVGHFGSIRWGDPVYTESIGMNNPDFFLNRVGVAFTSEEPDELKELFKQIEKELGRTPEDKPKERILIDIDLLQWNDRILKPLDLQQSYVQSVLSMLSDAGQENERSDQEAGFTGKPDQ